MVHQIGRRSLLGLAAAGAVAACNRSDESAPGPQSRQPASEFGGGTGQPDSYQEAPMLRAAVDAGDLPPLSERLPKNPHVVRPDELVAGEFSHMRRGSYGGTLQLAQESASGDPIIFSGNVESLIWAPNAFDFDEEFRGNVVEGFEVRADGTEFVFFMRAGLRWSDGEPVTIEDVEFAFHDVLLDDRITPVFPRYLRTGNHPDGTPAELQIIDDLTFGLTFDQPYGAFPSQVAIAGWISYADLMKPKHYLSQFHEKYASKSELEDLARDESVPVDQWFTIFAGKQLTGFIWDMTTEAAIGHPTLTPWTLTSADGSVFSYERNPYYFKVDPDGNQLPYIDGIRSQVIQDYETLTSRALMGEFDYLGERASLRHLSLIGPRHEQGDLQMSLLRKHALRNFYLNLTYDDETWRSVARDVRFRRALSLAINRAEIIEQFYQGEFARVPEESNPSEYDPDAANALLDEMGMNQRDDSDYRLALDGSEFLVPFELPGSFEDQIPMAELIAEYWGQVGIHTTVRQIDGGTLEQRMDENTVLATGGGMHHDIWRAAGWDDYLPGLGWGDLWNHWFETHGESGEEPPAEVKELFDRHAEFMLHELGSDESRSAIEAIIQSHAENIWTFCPMEHTYFPTFWSNRVGNVPQGGGEKDDTFGIVVTMSMEQWYLEDTNQ